MRGPVQLCLATCKDNPLENMTSKNICKELLNSKIGVRCICFQNKQTYTWANIIPVDTKTKEFQYKFVHDLLANDYWF